MKKGERELTMVEVYTMASTLSTILSRKKKMMLMVDQHLAVQFRLHHDYLSDSSSPM